MSWWNDLWLNEGFAVYLEYLATDDLNYKWKRVRASTNWGNKKHKMTTIRFSFQIWRRLWNDTLAHPVDGNKTSLVDTHRNKNQTTFSQLTLITFVRGTLLYLMYLVVNCSVRSSDVKKRSTYAKLNALFLCLTLISRNPLYANRSTTEGLALQISSSRPKRWSLELTSSWGQKLEQGQAC